MGRTPIGDGLKSLVNYYVLFEEECKYHELSHVVATNCLGYLVKLLVIVDNEVFQNNFNFRFFESEKHMAREKSSTIVRK